MADFLSYPLQVPFSECKENKRALYCAVIPRAG